MKTRLQGILLQIQNKWNELEKNQKIRLIVATLVLVAVAAASIYYITRPNWQALMTNEEVGTITDVEAQLTEAGIETQVSKNARDIYVKDVDATRARMYLSTTTIAGVDNDFTFADAIDLIGIGTTQTVQSEILINAEESELAYSLQNFDGVESATVEISLPKKTNYFLEDEDVATASVILKTTGQFTDWQAAAVAKYISRAVIGLDLENIDIMDTNANLLYEGSAEDSGIYSSTNTDVEKAKKAELETSISSLVSALYDDVEIYANVSYTWDKEAVNSTQYLPIEGTNTGVTYRESTDKSSAENATAGDEVGVGANDNEAANYVTDTGASYSADNQSVSKDYYVDVVETMREKSSGTFDPDSSALTLVLYDYVYYDEEYLTENEMLGDLSWDEYKESIDYNVLEIPDEIRQTVQVAAGMDNVSISALEVPIFVDSVPATVDLSEYIMFGGLALLIILLAVLIIRNTQVEEIEEVEPELAVEDLLVSSQLEEQIEQERLEELRIKKQSAAKEQIDKFVTEQPAAVANLLRTWLNEEWE
ncbi:MAG: hypothetical protein ACK5LY_10880 [Lachnospirales bacterium]